MFYRNPSAKPNLARYDLYCSQRDFAQLNCPFGDFVGESLQFLGNFVKKPVQADEVWTFGSKR
jgi:hypothetical protein